MIFLKKIDKGIIVKSTIIATIFVLLILAIPSANSAVTNIQNHGTGIDDDNDGISNKAELSLGSDPENHSDVN